MAHFPLEDYEHVTDPKVKAVYEEIRTELGFGMVPNLFKSMASNPDFLEASWKCFRCSLQTLTTVHCRNEKKQ
jgi:hypothetical protein